MKGKTDYEIARRYMKAALDLRDAIIFVRNPFISISEMKRALKESGFGSDEYKDNEKTNQAVYATRWKKIQEAQTNLEAELLEAEVSWGDDAVRVSDELNASVRELYAELRMYINGHGNETNDKLIYNQGTPTEPDDFSRKISESIDEIREFLSPHLL